ncbi:TetR/AcrR family transcriptional regulator [Roseateles sp. SL47]|uniref:TetR/AcrR family transcriptional regulator n=1 Tax=Roseateles sp. SL47 TaxID=2995138 RepID=UPI00226D64F3|nr:TetR/AcrR family transcriptional regulator [Roseateles sp. SL47]WAC71377.1 TetR/AcrR family transcriptional regulator [Roseateles sp. SL47]
MRTKTEERRVLILDIATEVFLEVGYEKASMAVISSRVGGSKATLYNYFPSKEELFLAVMEYKASRHMVGVFDQLHHDAPLEDVLIRFGIALLEMRLSPELVAIHRMAEHEADRTVVGQLIFHNGIERGWTSVGDFLAECMHRGILPENDPMVAAWHLKALIEANICDRRMLGVIRETPPIDEITVSVRRGVAVWLKGYGVEDAAAKGPDTPRRPASRRARPH